MDVIFMRHGQATDNFKKLLSDKEVYWSVLTDVGIQTVQETIENLPKNIDKMYVSPLPRTIQTSSLVFKKYPQIEVCMDNRIREFNFGKFSGKPNDEQVDKIRQAQKDGDFFVRFGDFGENRFEIESRICSFLKEIAQKNSPDSTILVITHGSVASSIKRVLALEDFHLSTGKSYLCKNIDFAPVFKYIEFLEGLKKR